MVSYLVLLTVLGLVWSLVPRPLPDFISQLSQLSHSCEIKSGSGLGTKLHSCEIKSGSGLGTRVHSCEIKSGSGLGMRLPSVSTHN